MEALSTGGRWIWTADWSEEDRKTIRLVHFIKEITADENGQIGALSTLRITADCRYKLYINGELVQYGPAKGDHRVHFLDTVKIERFLVPGINRIDVAVLHTPEDADVGNHSWFRCTGPIS